MNEVFATLKLGVALFVFLQAKPVIDEITREWATWGRFVADLAAILVSSALVVIVTGRLLGRLHLRVVWEYDRVESRGPCEQVRYTAGAAQLGGYNLSLRCTSQSVLSRTVVSYCRRNGGSLFVHLSPDQTIYFVPELMQNHPFASVSPAGVTFNLRRLDHGTVTWADVSLWPVYQLPNSLPVNCQYDLSLARAPGWLTRLLVVVESPLTEFSFERV